MVKKRKQRRKKSEWDYIPKEIKPESFIDGILGSNWIGAVILALIYIIYKIFSTS